MTRFFPLSLTLFPLVISLSACTQADEDDPFEARFADEYLISYEAVPSAQEDHWGPLDFSQTSYAERESLTVAVEGQIYAEILDALAFDCAVPDTQVTPGGFLLETNPSLQSAISAADCSRAEVEELSAAFGYVLRQWDVLVTDFAGEAGGIGFAIVEFPAGSLSPELAQTFFEHAADTEPGLGGGYTAFDDVMVFLNLRDGSDGEPYSGLEDAEFIVALDDASASFPAAETALVESGEGQLDAWFVSNDWSTEPEGEDFAAWFDEGELARLDELRAAHDQLVLDMF